MQFSKVKISFKTGPSTSVYQLCPDPSAVAVSRIRRIFYCRRKSAEK